MRAVIDRVAANHLGSTHGDGSMMDLWCAARRRTRAWARSRRLAQRGRDHLHGGSGNHGGDLTWIWYLLAHAPWAEEALHGEIDRVCGTRTPTLEDVASLDYTRAVVEEALRLYPPVAASRAAGARGGPHRRHRCAARGLVTISPWLMHRNPEIWDRPHHFVPERFLGPRRPRPTPIPLRIGPRICAGLQFGLTETILCLAILAQRFRLRMAPGVKVRPAARLTLRPVGGMPMTVHPR